MRDYGKVHTSFWSSATTRSMSEDARTLALYLLTSPHSTIAGVFRLPDGYVCEDLQWESERVLKGFQELFRNGFANRCETTKWVWIAKWFEWNPLENPNQCKAALKLAGAVPDDCGWKQAFMRVCGHFMGLAPAPKTKPSRNPFGTLSKPGTGTGTGTEEKPLSGEPDDVPAQPPDIDTPEGLIAYLNVRAGKRFEPVDANLRLLRGRLAQGATPQQVREVIDRQVREWSGTDMAKYLRPATLFNAEKFAQYAGESGGGGAPREWWLAEGYGSEEAALRDGVRRAA
jgi:uncharacterized phage protein (TIGR02220 family)